MDGVETDLDLFRLLTAVVVCDSGRAEVLYLWPCFSVEVEDGCTFN